MIFPQDDHREDCRHGLFTLKFVCLVEKQQQADRLERILKEKPVRRSSHRSMTFSQSVELRRLNFGHLHSMKVLSAYLQHGLGVVCKPEKAQRNAVLMFAVHRKEVVERDFGGCRSEKWLNVVY